MAYDGLDLVGEIAAIWLKAAGYPSGRQGIELSNQSEQRLHTELASMSHVSTGSL